MRVSDPVEAIANLRPEDEESRPESVAFDEEHGVETASFATWHAYEPSPPSVVDAVLVAIVAELREDGYNPPAVTFVDVGCGKGRVLMLASRHAFARVIGVDPASNLCRAAEQNILYWKARWPDTVPIEVWCDDASRLDWPEGPLVLYLYNPFDDKTLDRMLRKLPRRVPIWLAYVNPTYAAPLHRHGYTQVTESAAFDHYAWRLYRR